MYKAKHQKVRSILIKLALGSWILGLSACHQLTFTQRITALEVRLAILEAADRPAMADTKPDSDPQAMSDEQPTTSTPMSMIAEEQNSEDTEHVPLQTMAIEESMLEVQDLPQLTDDQVPTVYNKALADYYSDRFEEAIDGFKQVLAYQGKHELAPNAAYWLAETAYSKQNYNHAVILFQQVIDDYPSTSKDADAMLKVGKCREQLGLDEEALATYQQVIDTYPDSEAAQLARDLL